MNIRSIRHVFGFSINVFIFCFKGLNEKAEPVTWQVSGWPARILQHEMDHLDGVWYIDRMDSKTFNVKWAAQNE